MGDMRNTLKVLALNLKERDNWEDIGAVGKIMLEYISDQQDWNMWTASMLPRTSVNGNTSERCNESSCFIRGSEFLN
jgi:hypothetical protein